MEKSELIARFAQSDEDRILFARVLDKMAAAERRNIPAATNFLTAREQALIEPMLRAAGSAEFHFFGGAEGAERAVCCFLPDYLDESYLSGEDSPIAAVHAAFRAADAISHRDLLGSLMGSGIKRETVGDIYVGEGQCDFLVTREILPYVLQNITSAGRAQLSLSEIGFDAVTVPPVRVQEKRESVSALRLDSIVAAGCNLSRSSAAELIRRGAVTLEHLPCEKPDKAVAPGSVISIRGQGRLKLASVDGTTRKGRTAVTIQNICEGIFMISQEQIDRINALAKKAKTEGLTEEETAERAELRQLYVASVRENLTAQLDNTYIMDKKGLKHKLQPKKK